MRYSFSVILAGLLAALPVRAACPFDGRPATGLVGIDAQGDLHMTAGGPARLAGILWPGSRRATARTSLKATVEALLLGERLVAVEAGGADRWGRRALHLAVQAGGARTALWLQEELLREGLVHALPGPGDPCRQGLIDAEAAARRERLGVWSAVHRRARRWGVTGTSMMTLPGLVVYEGRVRSVRSGRRVVFVNFSGKRDRVPSLMLTQKQSAVLRASGRDPATFVGKTLTVRALASGPPPGRLELADVPLLEIGE